MLGSAEEHIGAAILEGYSLLALGSAAQEAVEGHLLICATCRARLTGIEPFNTVHFTEDGPFYSRVTHLRDGSFAAHHWGRQIDGGTRFNSLSAACKYLVDSFAQMFPEHKCGEDCGDASADSAAAHWIS
jgi:hypothetical protein